jgi:hypothetical protein
MLMAQTLVGLLGIYVLLGVVFAPFFVVRGVARIDPSVQQSSWGFRLLIVPGVIALWPLLAGRWWRGVQHPPTESNAHRAAAQERKP